MPKKEICAFEPFIKIPLGDLLHFFRAQVALIGQRIAAAVEEEDPVFLHIAEKGIALLQGVVHKAYAFHFEVYRRFKVEGIQPVEDREQKSIGVGLVAVVGHNQQIVIRTVGIAVAVLHVLVDLPIAPRIRTKQNNHLDLRIPRNQLRLDLSQIGLHGCRKVGNGCFHDLAKILKKCWCYAGRRRKVLTGGV